MWVTSAVTCSAFFSASQNIARSAKSAGSQFKRTKGAQIAAQHFRRIHAARPGSGARFFGTRRIGAASQSPTVQFNCSAKASANQVKSRNCPLPRRRRLKESYYLSCFFFISNAISRTAAEAPGESLTALSNDLR